jgi:hypothetical protein
MTRIATFVLAAALVAGSCSSGGGSGGKGGSGGGGCPAGSETCACYGNGTCNVGLSCASNLCVNLGGGAGATGTGGSSMATGGSPGTGGAVATGGTPGTGGSASGTGGVTGTGGATATGGVMGTGGSVGTGGSGTGGAPACSCSGSLQCTDDGHCANPKVIDDFWDCNKSINLINGRNGGWYAAADVGVNLAFAVGTPPSGFSDQTCGAWSTGGPTGNGTTTYAIMGASMTSGDLPYSFAGSTGLSVNFEGQSVGFVIKTAGNGYFQKILSDTSGAQTFQVPFTAFTMRGDSEVTTLDLTAVTDIQFNVLDPSMGYGFVVHAISLY